MSPIKKILILSANPKDTARLRLDEEVREISEGLKRSKHRDQFIIHQQWAVRLRDLRRAMLDHEPEIVHFCGHGEKEGVLVEDDHGNASFVNPEAISGLFELFSDHVECVLLNACYSQIQADAINEHIHYVIGMQKEITDKTALEFAVGFYDALGAGKLVEEAFKFACNAIQLYGLSEHLTPVLKKKANCPPKHPKPFSIPKVYHNLPQPEYGQFIGRDQEIAKIKQILQPYPYSQYPIVTIDGIGGIGKSALTLEIAHQYLRDYDNLVPGERFEAIIWTSAKQAILTGKGITIRHQVLRTIDDIYHAIAIALQREDIIQHRIEEQVEVVRNALTRQRTLIIVDNLETVDDEAIMDFLREIPAPTKVIVTTRHRLDVAYPIRLKGMPPEDARSLTEQECQKKEVFLDEEACQCLYDRTGGVPLAIVWSIGQMGLGYSPEAVLTRLEQPTSDIAKFCFDGAIAAIRDKSAYKLLLVLSLCADSANREALGYATDLSELDRDDGLVELEKLSLVNKKGERFNLLPLTKQFVLAEYQKFSEKDQLRERWIAYFRKYSEEFGGEYWKWADYNWILAEGENIISIIDWAIFAEHGKIALLFTHAAQRYLTLTGRWSKMISYGEKLQFIAQSLNDRSTLAWLNVRWLAPLYTTRGKIQHAEMLNRQSLALYQELNDIKGICFAMNGLGRTLRRGGQYEDAEKLYIEAMDLAQKHNYGDGVASVHYELGKLARDLEEWGKSKEHWNAVIQWCEEHEHVSELDVFSWRGANAQLGWVEFLSGNSARGKALLESSLSFFEGMQGKGHIVKLNRQLATIEKTLGNREKALYHLQKARFWAERLGMRKETQRTRELSEELNADSV